MQIRRIPSPYLSIFSTRLLDNRWRVFCTSSGNRRAWAACKNCAPSCSRAVRALTGRQGMDLAAANGAQGLSLGQTSHRCGVVAAGRSDVGEPHGLRADRLHHLVQIAPRKDVTALFVIGRLGTGEAVRREQFRMPARKGVCLGALQLPGVEPAGGAQNDVAKVMSKAPKPPWSHVLRRVRLELIACLQLDVLAQRIDDFGMTARDVLCVGRRDVAVRRELVLSLRL